MTQAQRTGRLRVTVADVRREGQPASIRSRATAEHWSADVLWRKVSPYVSTMAIRAGVTANGVTAAMIFAGWLAAASLLFGTVWGAVGAVVFAHAQMILDAADGEVARWRRTQSPRGVFLDRIAHTTTEALLPACLGFGLALRHPGDPWPWAAGGLALAALVLINKSVNDGVAVARAASGLSPLKDTPDARQPVEGRLRGARNAARFLPIHRAYHSVEQAHIYLVAFLIALVVPSFMGWFLVGALVLTPLVIVGHVVAAMNSPRLTP